MSEAVIADLETPTIVVVVGRIGATRNALALHESIISTEGAVILVDKPYGETSFHVVNKIRKGITESTGIKWVKVGHAGTLDPLASGLLLIATRRSTKRLHELTGLSKTYLLKLRLGISSPSFDLERPIQIVGNEMHVTEQQVRDVAASFLGEIEQLPPMFSAIKQAGRPVYHRAREGEEVTMTPRIVTIHSMEVTKVALPFVECRVDVSKGTYIRSLVRDIGVQLGTGAVLTELVRETVGEWHLNDALTLEEAAQLARPQRSHA